MLECEIKLFDIRREDIITTLQRIWAELKHTELLVDIYLKSANTKQVRSRIRCTEHTTKLTCKYKLPSTSTKQAYEFDTTIPHSYVIDEERRSKVVDHVRIKKRTSYTRWGYIFDIDEYRWVPPVLEIEWPDEMSIQKVIALLGRQKYTQSVCGGKWVYTYYNVTHPETTPWFVWRLLSLIRCL
jgi:adenylate cyclase class IV